MKSLTKLPLIFFLIAINVMAQQEKGIVGVSNWLNNWTEFNPKKQEFNEPTQIITGNIDKDTKLYKRHTYLLLGNVFVTNNATLTIEPGTIILGDFDSKASLTISKGAKLSAEGLETDPIVFTSNRSVKRPGDWGGIIILGDAPTNKSGSTASFYSDLKSYNYDFTNYGGDNEESNSGALQFVRIEFAGKRIKGAGYFNGLLLAGVGPKTTLNNIMVSYCAGDAFEIWGGEFKLNQAVSYRNSSNDYKFNYGAQCDFYNSLAVRNPYASGNEGSKCLEVLSYVNKSDVDLSKPGTTVMATNVSLINDSKDLKNDIENGLVREAVFIGKDATLKMNKTVISGFNPAVILDEKITVNQENLEKIELRDMYFNNCKGNIFVENNSNNDDLENWYGNSAFYNVYSKGANSETFINMSYGRVPDFRLRINGIIASNED